MNWNPLHLSLALIAAGSLLFSSGARAQEREFEYLYAGVFGGTCGANCGGLEVFAYNSNASSMANILAASGSAGAVGTIGPLLELQLGRNVIDVGETQHVQASVVAGAYWWGQSHTNPTESTLGAGIGLEAAYSLRFGKIQVRPLVRWIYSRGGVGSGTGFGPYTVAEVHAVWPIFEHLLLFGRVGWQSVELNGNTGDKVDTKGKTIPGIDLAHAASSPFVLLGVAF